LPYVPNLTQTVFLLTRSEPHRLLTIRTKLENEIVAEEQVEQASLKEPTKPHRLNKSKISTTS
jgi:hypothetical protein